MFFRIVTSLILLFSSRQALALQVRALYKASCERELGVIIDVSNDDLTLLTLAGKLISVPRYEVIYWASFSIDSVPIEHLENYEALPLYYNIKTYQDGQFVNLASGWPVAFSKDRISFLSITGGEVLIQKASMWKIEKQKLEKTQSFKKKTRAQYRFAHPQIFSYCEKEKSNSAQPLIYAEQLLGDPITIKRELDQLQAGYRALNRNYKDQQFYPRPEIYKNKTSLGLWFNANSRYGSTGNRSNNFTPILVDEFSSGPFAYQRRFVTGAAPIMDTLHEEAQTQLLYEFKADYFHLSAMADPSTILVGSSYNWQASDLGGMDVRAVEVSSFKFGFDYDKFAIELGSSGTHLGTKYEGLFSKETVGVSKFGLTMRLPTSTFSFYTGTGNATAFDLTWLRFNYAYASQARWRLELSFINRDINYDGVSGDLPLNDFADFKLESSSKTFAAYYYYLITTRHEVGGFLSSESIQNQGSLPTSKSEDEYYFKVGIMGSLFF